MSDGLPAGRLAGVDYGRRRIGVAICDAERIICSPLCVHQTTGDRAVDTAFFQRLVVEETVAGFVVGLPIHADGSTSSANELHSAEVRVRLLAAYRWMHHRMPELFPELEEAIAVCSATNQYISNSLKKKVVRRCRRCGHGLPTLHKFAICDPCFSMRYERAD